MKDMMKKVVNARMNSLPCFHSKPLISFMVTKTITKLTNKPKPVNGTQTHKISSGCEMQPQLFGWHEKNVVQYTTVVVETNSISTSQAQFLHSVMRDIYTSQIGHYAGAWYATVNILPATVVTIM